MFIGLWVCQYFFLIEDGLAYERARNSRSCQVQLTVESLVDGVDSSLSHSHGRQDSTIHKFVLVVWSSTITRMRLVKDYFGGRLAKSTRVNWTSLCPFSNIKAEALLLGLVDPC